MEKMFEMFDTLSKFSDPRMDRFLMRSPLQPIAVSLLYLVFIYKIGPKLMENRKPFDLRKIIIAYNISQIVTNVVLFKMFFNVAPHLNILCSPSADLSNNSTATLMLKPHYYYTLLKYYDLTETIFFVLRKKRRQISYLHVHHHIGMLAAAWISCKYFPGGQALYVGLYNTFIHSVMYCYYLLTAWNSDYGRGAWWKKYITLMQIVQHYMILLSVFPSVMNVNCSYPKGWMGLFSVNVLLIIYLFTKFYQENYMPRTKIKNK